MKIVGGPDRVHWSYSDIVFYGEGCVPWQQPMVRSQIWRKAVEACTGDIQAKFGGRSDRVHWSYSNIVFYGEGCISMETAYDDTP